jgi:hypothetical protein
VSGNRLDYKIGRFTRDYETTDIKDGLHGWEYTTGDFIDWYRFESDSAEVDDVYDEGTGIGKIYRGPIRVPVIRLVHSEGSKDDSDVGRYYNDDFTATLQVRALERLGFDGVDINTFAFAADRVAYDQKLFRVMDLRVMGQMNHRDIIVALTATQLRPDEIVNDPQFMQFTL